MSVQAWQDELVLKTYVLGPDDPYPPWHRTGWSRIYPYPMQDNLPDDARPLAYRALHLENDRLHLIVLPELGGHLHSLYDKVARREVFYRNRVVKYGFVARRGAWISGGIEFNFPQGHTCATVSPVSSRIATHPETGAPAIVIGCTDRVCRMRWAVTLSLAPDEARMRQDVLLCNPMPYRQRHYFWANSAVPARDDLRMVYPTRRVLTWGGIREYPIIDGRDMGLYRNHPRADDFFAQDGVDDFFAAYYEDGDFGTAHWADHREDLGRKFFTWGTADEGMAWVDLLTDDDGQYVEIQAGRFVDQSTFEFLAPYQDVGWTEYWYGFHGLGGLSRAGAEAALSVKAEGGAARVGAVALRDGGPAELVLTSGRRCLWRGRYEMATGAPVSDLAPLPGDLPAGAPLELTLLVKGREVLRCEEPAAWTQRAVEVSAGPPAPAEDEASAEELAVRAVAAEKVLDFAGARRLAEKALARDPGLCAAHVVLGVLDYQAGLYDAALDHLRRAVAREPERDEAAYYLGAALAAVGRDDEATEVLWRLLGRSACRREAAVVLARLALRAGDAAAALRHLQAAPDGPVTRFLRAVALRLVGRAEEARQALADAIATEPLGAAVLAEAYLAAFAAGDGATASAALAELLALLDPVPDEWLEVALRHADLGLTRDAARLLEAACINSPAVAAMPMAHYHLARLGRPEGRAEELRRAAGASPACCFPSRLEDLAVLRDAAAEAPGDPRPRLYLGSLLASLDRRDEALAAWEEAAGLDDADPVVCRNLALAYRLWRSDFPASLAWYDKAIAASPTEHRLWLERDDALVASGAAAEARLAAFEAAPPEVLGRADTAARRADCLVHLRRWDEALSLLRSYRYKPWEGARATHSLWAAALTGRAADRRAAGDLAGALEDLELALTYPRNLGVGKAAYPEEAGVHWQAAEVAGELGDDERRRAHLVAAADEPHLQTCEADLWKAKALRALGREDEAAGAEGALRQWASQRLERKPDDAGAAAVLDALAAG